MTNHLYDALFAPHAENDACFLVLDQPGSPDQISFRTFIKRANQMANVLTAHDVRPGDRVVVQMPKRSEMLELYAATIKVGAAFLPLNTAYTADELTYFLKDAVPKLIVLTNDMGATLTPLANSLGAAILTLEANGTGTLNEAQSDAHDDFATVPRAADDLAGLLYTSGTTGRSKGAMMTHENLLSNARVLTDLWRITDSDTLIHALPIFHTHGLFVAMNTALLGGAKVRFMPGFDTDAIVAALPTSTLMMGVPTFYTRVLDDERFDENLTRRMRLFVSGSAPMLAETHQAFTARTGHHILERYGMTETNMITSNPYDGERRAGTVGFALPGTEVRLTEPGTDQPSEPGKVGMIEVRGPNVFKGYWQMPQKTAEELRDDGFFITGDLGQYDEDGYLKIVGRQKDLIITGGYNVYPREIEEVLNDIDGVEESAVYGAFDADFGERIIADVVPLSGVDVTIDILKSAVAAKLARFKHPKEFRIVSALPRNSMGKVQKNVLREVYSKAP